MPLQRQQLEGLAQGLEPGSYQVRVTISDGNRGASRQRHGVRSCGLEEINAKFV